MKIEIIQHYVQFKETHTLDHNKDKSLSYVTQGFRRPQMLDLRSDCRDLVLIDWKPRY